MAKTKTISPNGHLIFFKSKAKPKPSNFILQTYQLHLKSSSLRIYNSKISSSSIQFAIPSNSLNRNPKTLRSHHSPLFTPSLHPIKPFVQSQWRQILGGWVCSVISVYCLSKIVPKVGNFSAVLVRIDANRLLTEGLVLGVMFCVRLISNYLQQAFLWSAALRSAYEIRVHVFERVLERDLGFFERGDGVSSGDIAYRITAEASDVADTVHALLNTIVPSTLQLVVVVTHMLLISPALSLISALIIPPTCLIIAYLGERLRKISKKAHISVAELSTHLNEDVGKAYNDLKQGEPAIDRLFDLTSFSSQVIEEPDAVHLDSVTGDVKFCNILFGYGENMPLVLDGLNLHIKSGQTVALIGPSGGGKTTLTKLLLRLYDPLQGSVLIDDVNIRNIQLKCLRKHVGLVSQDVALLSGTVAENIGYQDLIRGIDIVRVEHAAKTANAHEFIKALPRGYDTDIGQRGTILSGGQKQRLAIARAIYQNPSILILDEATSALDSKSELLVRQAVERLMRNRTVLVIAHRIETILMADQIVILENGKLQEITRASLLNGSNRYSLLPPD